MTYAAATHFNPSRTAAPGGEAAAAAPWELDAELSPARHETWLLSFIDILALLLTLFVLLLAHQKHHPHEAASAPAVHFDFSGLTPGPVSLASPLEVMAPDGFAIPGNGLVPLDGVPADNSLNQADEAPLLPVVVPAAETETAGGEQGAGTQVAPAPEPAMAGTEVPESATAGTRAPESGPPVVDAPAMVAPGVEAADDRQTTGTAVIPEVTATAGRAGEDLLAILRNSELGRQVEVTARPGKVNLEISDSILFTPASAALSAGGLALLDQLAAILRTLPYELSVEGHTDNVPIHTSRYPSNWELSAARAAMVTRKLIDQGIAADRVRAIGYGDTRPRSDNLSPEGRARNRRVTFVLQVPGGD